MLSIGVKQGRLFVFLHRHRSAPIIEVDGAIVEQVDL
jgi:hypothetical protein